MLRFFDKRNQSRKTNFQKQSAKVQGQRPAFMERLIILCRPNKAHPLPVKKTFIGWSTASNGLPMAVYACPYVGCRHREGWVRHRGKGKPMRLWAGMHNGHK